MNNVFIFWIGDKEKVLSLVNTLKAQDMNVHLGPSKKEHEFLYDNFKYYRDSFDQKIYSFCSDVWRFYMLSNNDGMYIDSSVEIGKNFSKFYKTLEKEGTVLFKESKNALASCVLFNKGNSDLFMNALDFYKLYDSLKVNIPRLFWIGPLVITRSANIMNFNVQRNILDIRDRETIFKKGMNSWSKGQGDKYWSGIEKLFRDDRPPFSKRAQNLLNNSNSKVDIYGLRDAYDFAKDKNELLKIKGIYKKIEYKISLPERLIWSRLYRMFRF